MSETNGSAELAVVIGRFQPFHYGHLALVEHALALAPRAMLVLGSAAAPRSVKNPFSVEERIAAIRGSLGPEQQSRVVFAPVRDYYDEARWAHAVKAAINRETQGAVALVGFNKDDSTYYLALFPEWRQHALPRQAPIDGTQLRRLYFGSEASALPAELATAVPPAMLRFLSEFRQTPHFERLREELLALDQSRAKYGDGPFVTVDALVTHGQRILLVQRRHAPGKDSWALPGGFLEGSERLLAAAIRELREETTLASSLDELRAALRSVAVFDHPQRSQRGRTITHAHHFALSEQQPTPSVAGADDARTARWFGLEEIPNMTEQLIDDHYAIIDHFLKLSRD
jgi:bifunctional NMN adenylyltransferase/nudix hydrolase